VPPVPLAFDSRGANANRAYLALALGLVSRIAATRAIDAIVVKGAAAELTGLRPPRDFSDVEAMRASNCLRMKYAAAAPCCNVGM